MYNHTQGGLGVGARSFDFISLNETLRLSALRFIGSSMNACACSNPQRILVVEPHTYTLLRSVTATVWCNPHLAMITARVLKKGTGWA